MQESCVMSSAVHHLYTVIILSNPGLTFEHANINYLYMLQLKSWLKSSKAFISRTGKKKKEKKKKAVFNFVSNYIIRLQQ